MRTMKQLLMYVIFSITLLCACETYQGHENYTPAVKIGDLPSEYVNTDLRDATEKIDDIRRRENLAKEKMDKLLSDEMQLVKKLTDDQLVAYQLADKAYKADDLASNEITLRNLRKVCDPNIFSEITLLLSRKGELYDEIVLLQDERTVWFEQAERKIQDLDKKQNQAEWDYRFFMMNRMQNY